MDKQRKEYIKEQQVFGGKIRATLRNAKTGEITFQTGWSHNIIPRVGLNALLRGYGNVDSGITEQGHVTFGALGSGSSTPADDDTIMLSEVVRKPKGDAEMQDNTLIIEVFFAEGDGNGIEITQFALFGEDATGAADSGTLMEYANFETPFTKTVIETLIVEVNVEAASTT